LGDKGVELTRHRAEVGGQAVGRRFPIINPKDREGQVTQGGCSQVVEFPGGDVNAKDGEGIIGAIAHHRNIGRKGADGVKGGHLNAVEQIHIVVADVAVVRWQNGLLEFPLQVKSRGTAILEGDNHPAVVGVSWVHPNRRVVGVA